MKALTLALVALLAPGLASAAVFDTVDILPKKSGALGVFGEILLNDPTSEGLEARGRYGLSDELNVIGIVGQGSRGKGFRIGGEAVYNILPDWEGQIGLSVLGTALYLRRFGVGGIHLRAGVMGHKKVDGWHGRPALVYAALPFNIDARSGTYKTGAQIVLGTLMDLSSRFYAGGEAGIKMGNTESYVLLGAGVRFGELRFEKKRRGSESSRPAAKPGEREYTDEDFQ